MSGTSDNENAVSIANWAHIYERASLVLLRNGTVIEREWRKHSFKDGSECL